MTLTSVQPALHASLNATAAILLVLGWLAIRGYGPFRSRGRDEVLHRRFMLAALAVSTIFLSSYLHYHFKVGHVAYPGSGTMRLLYLVILVPHVILAAVMVPLIALTVMAAWRRRLDRHRRLARVTLPIWLYVSVTGVLIYFMAYVAVPA